MTDLYDHEQKLKLLLAKYDGKKHDNSSDVSEISDMSEIGILRRENRHLKEVIESQKEVIELFRTKYLDLALEYNEKIDGLRQDHQNELQNLHFQFKERIKKEKHNS